MPTIRRCCIVGCLSNSRQTPQLQFFQFPKPNNPFHTVWKQACHASLSRILPFKKPVVCALHFPPRCIGGRRLTGSAVPSLNLEVPRNLKAVEQQAMMDEIERSRKNAFINAVVFEWLIRANLDVTLRGSITHGMIKERADEAKQIIGLTCFVADNRWLNRFRETHLHGFAQKLADNQLRPVGNSLKVIDIVHDLQHHFPPTSADRLARLDTMPNYVNLMQSFDQQEADDHSCRTQLTPTNANNNAMAKLGHDSNYFRRQSHGSDYSSTQQRSSTSSPQSAHMKRIQPANGPSPLAFDVLHKRIKLEHEELSIAPQSEDEDEDDDDDDDNINENDHGHEHARSRTREDGQRREYKEHTNSGNAGVHANAELQLECEPKPDLEPEREREIDSVPERKVEDDDDRELGQEQQEESDRNRDVERRRGPTIYLNRRFQDWNRADVAKSPPTVSLSSSSSSSEHDMVEIHSYKEAMEYLKPLEEFVILKENFRAIGLLAQLENVLNKGDIRLEPSTEQQRMQKHTYSSPAS